MVLTVVPPSHPSGCCTSSLYLWVAWGIPPSSGLFLTPYAGLWRWANLTPPPSTTGKGLPGPGCFPLLNIFSPHTAKTMKLWQWRKAKNTPVLQANFERYEKFLPGPCWRPILASCQYGRDASWFLNGSLTLEEAGRSVPFWSPLTCRDPIWDLVRP